MKQIEGGLNWNKYIWGLNWNQDNDTWQGHWHMIVPCHVALTMPHVTPRIWHVKKKKPEANTYHAVNDVNIFFFWKGPNWNTFSKVGTKLKLF